MADNFGINFAPPATRVPGQRPGEPSLGPAQRAIQTLSLQLPRVLGARALSPQSLLNPSPGGGGSISPESAVLQTVMRTMGSSLPSPAQPNPMGGPFPSLATPSAPASPEVGGAYPEMPSMPGMPSQGGPSNPFQPQGGGGPSIEELIEEMMRRMQQPAPGPHIIPGQGPTEPGPAPPTPPLPMPPPVEPGPSEPVDPQGRFPADPNGPEMGGMERILRMFT